MNRSRISRFFLAAVAGALAAGTTHVVVKGDTLWDITGKYLGNPFQWPSVWEKNPQIKNAHWIYPGDTVQLDANGQPVGGSGAGNTAAAGSGSEGGAAPVVTNDPLAGFAQNPDNIKMAPVDTVAGALELVIPPSQSMLNLEIVTTSPVLQPEDEPIQKPQSELVFDEDYGHHLLMPGHLVQTKIGEDQGLKVGDRMEIIERDDAVATNVAANLKGRIEETRGLCDIAEVHKKTSICRLVAVYGAIGTGARVRHFLQPVAASVTAFENVQEPSPAKVLVNDRLGRVQMPGTAVIIDRGEIDGIGQGDIYEFMANGVERGILAMRGHGLVVRTTRTTATIKIVGASTKAINVGDKAWRIRRSVRG